MLYSISLLSLLRPILNPLRTNLSLQIYSNNTDETVRDTFYVLCVVPRFIPIPFAVVVLCARPGETRTFSP